VVLTGGPLGLVAGPLPLLLPVVVQPLTLRFDVPGRSQAQLPSGRLQNLQHLLGDEGIQASTREALTEGAPVVNLTSLTQVVEPLVRAVVMRTHAVTAAAADQQAAQQSGPLPDGAA